MSAVGGNIWAVTNTPCDKLGQYCHFLVVMRVNGNHINWRSAVQSVNALWREADDTTVVLHGFINNFIIGGVRNMTTQNQWCLPTFCWLRTDEKVVVETNRI